MTAYILGIQKVQNDISIGYADNGMTFHTSWGFKVMEGISVWNELKPMECNTHGLSVQSCQNEVTVKLVACGMALPTN